MIIKNTERLSIRQFLKSFAQIRWKIQGFQRHLFPTEEQWDNIEQFFVRVSSAYSSIFRSNNIVSIQLYILESLIRFCGQAYYDHHIDDYRDQISNSKLHRYITSLEECYTRLGVAGVFCPVTRI